MTSTAKQGLVICEKCEQSTAKVIRNHFALCIDCKEKMDKSAAYARMKRRGWMRKG